MKLATLILLTVLLVISTAARGAKACEDGWTLFEKNCYLFNHNPRSWSDAHGVCQARGARLVDILNSGENDFVRQNIRASSWTGLKQSMKRLVWNSNFDDQLGAEDFDNWIDGRPTNNQEDDCVEIRTCGRWSNKACSLRRRYVCKKAGSGGCSGSWERYGSYCYYFSSSSYTWAEASTRCSRSGGRLADIRREGENEFIRENLQRSSGYSWIGLHRERRYWSNNDRDDQPTYRWFADGHPNRSAPVSCIRIDNTGSWYDLDCGNNYNFVCKKEAGCADPGSPSNTRRTTSKGPPFHVGDVITYACADGYEVTSGNAVRTCQPGGSFNGTAPVCSDVDECVPEEDEVFPFGDCSVTCGEGTKSRIYFCTNKRTGMRRFTNEERPCINDPCLP